MPEGIEEKKFAEVRERGRDRTEEGERARETEEMENYERRWVETPEGDQTELRTLKEKVERLTERVERLEITRREDNEGSSTSGSDGEPGDRELRHGAWWLKVDYRRRMNARESGERRDENSNRKWGRDWRHRIRLKTGRGVRRRKATEPGSVKP